MDDKSKVKQDKDFVSCEEEYELNYIKKKLKKEYPSFTDEEIDEALKSCCKDVPAPRPRDKYMECLEKKLNINDPGVSVKIREAKVKKLIKRNMYLSAGIGLLPFPILDLAALLVIQIKMTRDLSKMYDIPFVESRGKSIILSLLGGLNLFALSAVAYRGLLKFIPGVGNILGAASFSAFAGAITYAIGKVFVHHFEMGGTLLDFDPEKLKKYFREQYEEGMEKAKEMKKTAK